MHRPIDKDALSETGQACLEAASTAALSVCNAGWTADRRGLQFFHTGTVDALVRRGWLKVDGHGRHRLAFITPAGRSRLVGAHLAKRRAEERAQQGARA